MNTSEAKKIVGELLEQLVPRTSTHRKIKTNEFAVWTETIKSILAEIGTRKGYDCLYSNRQENLHEFLLDFVWWDKQRKVMVLACESEFGNTRRSGNNPEMVGEDFDKLLSVKAEFKLMIFDSYGSTSDKFLQEMNQHLSEFGQHNAGELYMIVDTCDLDNERTRVWKCETRREGKDESLIFKTLEEWL